MLDLRRPSRLALAAFIALVGATQAGCIAASEAELEDGEELVEDGEEALKPGVNGKACLKSPYNCRLRPQGGNRVDKNDGDEKWSVSESHILDGNGHSMGLQTWDHLRFNYGQRRKFDGVLHVFTWASSVHSAGWVPADAVWGEDSLLDKMGRATAKDPKRGKMACYEIKETFDPSLVDKKIMYDTTSDYERGGDYLSMPRGNGQSYANLCFNTPGFGLGGVAVDIFPAGTKFQRVKVPTSSGRPSVDVPLWVKDSAGRYRKRSGSMKFFYGYVKTEPGTKRFGWMSANALKKSSGGP